MENQYLTPETIEAIDDSRLTYLSAGIQKDYFDFWMQMAKMCYPDRSCIELLYTACGLSACLVLDCIAEREYKETNIYRIGYCYEIVDKQNDHVFIIIPGENTCQIIESSLGEQYLDAYLCKYKDWGYGKERKLKSSVYTPKSDIDQVADIIEFLDQYE